MHNLVIDIGNSFSKIAVFQNRELISFSRQERLDVPFIAQLISQYQISRATLASVANAENDIVAYLKKEVDYVAFSTAIDNGVKSLYQSQHTLGADRWAKVLAAKGIYPHTNCLLIDAGTCITYDVLSATGVYQGGSISLGIKMRLKALNHYTKRLPLVDFNSSLESIPDGNNTNNAILSGVLYGAVNEVEGYIRQQPEAEKIKIVLSGGDAEFLSKQLKNSIFAPQISVDPYWVLRGLNEVITQ